MDRLKDILSLSVFILLIVMLCLQQCSIKSLQSKVESIKPDSSVTIVNNYYDSMPKVIKVPSAPLPADSILVEIPAKVDTNAILHRYFNKYYYSQTLTDSCLKAVITDSITQNKIIARSFTYQWLKPIKIETKTEQIFTAKKNLFLVGASLHYINNSLQLIPQASWLRNQKILITGGTSILQPQPNIFTGVQIRIGNDKRGN